MSILDDELVQKIQTAFSLHPWVANVTHVTKRHPAHVDVELEYRKPVAMVEVHENGSDGLYPVDTDGVLLPSTAVGEVCVASDGSITSSPRVAMRA